MKQVARQGEKTEKETQRRTRLRAVKETEDRKIRQRKKNKERKQ
jgi:hypothetical protein